MKNELDEIILKKFEEHEFSGSDAGWETLRKSLPPNKTNKKALWITSIGIAASLFITAITLGWFTNGNNNHKALVKSKNIPSTTTPQKETTQAIVKQETQAPAHNITTQKYMQYPHKNHLFPQNSIAAQSSDNCNTLPPSINTSNNPPETIMPQAGTPTAPQTSANTELSLHNPPTKQPKLAAENEIGFAPSPSKQNNKINLSLAGALNYGSLNTGYAAGLNAHQKIGRKLFLEGDLSVANNRSNNVSVISASQFAAFNSASGSLRPVSNAVQQSTASFLYLQFNPSVGYNVHPKIALSFGADLQKLLDNNGSNKTVIFNADEPKQLPSLDVGLTGKTEVSVTPRLKAGILYREGMNNLIHGSNEYFDRRYLQVQLKFRVLGK